MFAPIRRCRNGRMGSDQMRTGYAVESAYPPQMAHLRSHGRPHWRPVSGEQPSPGVMRPNRRWPRRLAHVRNRSRFRRGGHEARWHSLAQGGDDGCPPRGRFLVSTRRREGPSTVRPRQVSPASAIEASSAVTAKKLGGSVCRVARRTFTSGLSQVGSRTGAPV
jgi:hypothetical protein